MIEFSYPISVIEEMHNVKPGTFVSNIPIIDCELGNDISDDWDYSKGIVICVGYLYLEKMNIMVADSANDEDFKKYVVQDLTLINQRNPFHAFNHNFEEGVIKNTFGLDLKINEIKPFKAKGWNKDRFFEEVKKNNPQYKDLHIRDPFKGDGSLCASYWQNYLRTRNNELLFDVIAHNKNCLLKELMITKKRKQFMVSHKYKTDKNGFLIE